MRPHFLLILLVACNNKSEHQIVEQSNVAPTAPEISITPSAPTTIDSLSANISVEASDTDGDALTYSFLWYRDGTEFGSDASVDAAATSKNETWSVAVTASDGTDSGTPGTAQVVIANTPPELLAASIEPSEPTVGEDLTLSLTSADEDGDAVSYRITWTVDGVELGEYEDLTDIPSSATASGDKWAATITPDDGEERGTALMVSTKIDNTLPTVDAVTITPSTPAADDILTAEVTGAIDGDGDAVSLAYGWLVNGGVAHEETTTATTATLETELARGWTVQVRVTPADPWAEGDPVLSDEVIVGNSPPTVDSAELTPDPPTVGSGVSVSASTSDIDRDAVTLEIEWSVNGSVSSETGATLSSGFVRDDEIFAVVTPTDGIDQGAPVTTDTVTVANTAPSASSVVIQPSAPLNSDALSAVVSGWSDADGDPEGYTYQWLLAGAAITGATDATLGAATTGIDDVISVEVTPTDGIDDGATLTSATVTITNSPPVADADVLDSASVAQCDEVILDASGSSDADGDTLAFSWSITAQPADSALTNSDIDAQTDEQPTVVPDAVGTFTFEVGVTDGAEFDSDSVDIEVAIRTDNNDPEADAGSDQSNSGYATCTESSSYGWTCDSCTGGTFVLDASASTDIDGDPLTYLWSTSSTYATIADATAEITTIDLAGLPTDYGEAIQTVANVLVRAEDCAGGFDEAYITLTFICEGI